jgi:putative methionine-R-sulfoxide reductase with GAF domain
METVGSNPLAAARELPLSLRTRRRQVRQKVHTPAYASLNGSSSGQILDLSEIVDISEEGMAIQTSFPLEVQRSVNLCLDLTATRACIHTTGEVIWCDGSGRVGISFPQMQDAALRQLKEWLFVNVMVACVNYRADVLAASSSTNQFAAEPAPAKQFRAVPQPVPEKPSENSALFNWMRQELEPMAPADYTSILTALAAVKREIDALGSNLDGALQLLAQRAQTFTRATGAAIALTEGASMICRASAGQDAPGPGTRFSIGSGFSGECVRTGQWLRCDDSETDPFVDRESCRSLGIRSIIAVPIRWDEAVIGILEVFAPEPYAFSTNDPLALKRLAGIISSAVHRAGVPEPSTKEIIPAERDWSGHGLTEKGSEENESALHSSLKFRSVPAPVASLDDEFPVETSAGLSVPHLSRSRKILLAAAAATVLFAGTWLISPRDFTFFSKTTSASAAQPLAQASPNPPPPAVVAPGGMEGLRLLAEKGDPAAQFSMGARYATGEEVPQDYAEAVRWFSMAAEQGHVVSQATLGAYYWAGRGVPQDLVKAYFWSVLAQAGGDEASKYRVSVLASRMTHAQVSAAEQQANDWIKEHQSVSQNSSAPQQ